jgi:hypothetical protein
VTTPTGETSLDELFDRLQRGAPAAAGFIGWVRKPSSKLIRIPLAVLLLVGGVLSFLPVLGIWMLPLGFLILAIDIPPLQRPAVRAALWIEERWRRWQEKRKKR